MEDMEDIMKRGILYVQQQRFGKKWKKVWSIVYKESKRSMSRMEFFECKDSGEGSQEKSERALRKQENKKVIKLRDCIRVSEVEMEGCPKDCRAFLVETTEKLFVFAAVTHELSHWTHTLCEIAFPMNRSEVGALKSRAGQLSQESTEEIMEDNSLYGQREHVMKDFKVTVRKTEATERCMLRGTFNLRTDFDSLLLKDRKSGEVLFTWPYRWLRRFGRDKVTFSFEAGRRCESGEGNFEFETKQANLLFQALETAINLQKNNFPPMRQASSLDQEKNSFCRPGNSALSKESRSTPDQGSRSRLEPPGDKLLTGVKSLTLDTRPPPHKSQVKNISSCPLLNSEDMTYSQIALTVEHADHGVNRLSSKTVGKRASQEAEYSLPFDNVAKSLTFQVAQSFPVEEMGCGREASVDEAMVQDPLYDSIDESAIRLALQAKSKGHLHLTYTKQEHIYDEPEGSAMVKVEDKEHTSIYDNPEEVKGHAWKYQGTALDPSGHEFPYSPHSDDYAVPKPPRKLLPDPSENEGDDSPYDNVMVKITERGKK